MPTLPYLSGPPDGAAWNVLLTEFDRRLSLVFDGRTPLILNGRAGFNYVGLPGLLGAGGLLGTPFIFGTAGGPYYTAAQADPVLEPFWKIYDHAALTAIAAAATEIGRDGTRQVLRVSATADTAKLEGSLQAHTRVDGADTFWLGVGPNSRPLRRHRHAVAEAIVEGITTLEWPAAYDRYECVRVHNLNDATLTVWVHGLNRWGETPVWAVSGGDAVYTFTATEAGRLAVIAGTADLEAVIDGTTHAATGWPAAPIAAGQSVTVRWVGGAANAGQPVTGRAQLRADLKLELPRFGCRSFRRTPSYLDASLRYVWKFRAAKSRPRFLVASGHADRPPERSAAANPVCRPFVLLEWLDAVGAQFDPAEPCDLAAQFPMFGSPTSPGAKWRDVLHHTGPLWSVTVGAGGEIIHTKGRFNGYATLAADLAPLGVAVSEAGDGTITLSRAAGAPGVAPHLDLLALGTNLLHYEDGGLVPMEYKMLPASLANSFTRTWDRAVFAASAGTEPVTLTYLNPDGSTNSTVHDRARMVVSGVTPSATETVSLNAVTSLTLFAGAAGAWQLTPSGWQRPWQHTVAATRPIFLPDGQPLRPDNILLYDDLNGSGWIRRGALRVQNQGWPLDQPGNPTPYALRPDRPRKVSGLAFTAGIGSYDPRFDGVSHLRGTPGGGDIVPVEGGPGLTWTDYAKLRPLYLSQTRSNYGTVERTHSLFAMPDQVWVAQGAAWPFTFGQRAAFQNLAADTSDQYFLRLPLRAHEYNLLAWRVNAWRRAAPLIGIEDPIFRSGGVDLTLQMATAVGASPAFLGGSWTPKDCCGWANWDADTWWLPIVSRQAWCDGLGLVPRRLADLPGYNTAAAAAAHTNKNLGAVKLRRTPGPGRMEVVSSSPPWTTYRQVVDQVTLEDLNQYEANEFNGSYTWSGGGQFGASNPFRLAADLRWWKAGDIRAFAESKGMAFRFSARGVPCRLATEAPVTPTRLLAWPAVRDVTIVWPNPGGTTTWTTNDGPPAVNLAPPEESWTTIFEWPNHYVRFVPVTTVEEAEWLVDEDYWWSDPLHDVALTHNKGFASPDFLGGAAAIFNRQESVPTGRMHTGSFTAGLSAKLALWSDHRPPVIRDADMSRVRPLAVLQLAHDPTGKLVTDGALQIPDGRITFTPDWWSSSATLQLDAHHWPRTWTPANPDQATSFTALPPDGTLRIFSAGLTDRTWQLLLPARAYLDLA